MNTRWHDLIIDRLEDGGIHLEQKSGVDDPNVIHLHPEQLLFVARQLCGMRSETAQQAGELERRIAVLTDKLQNIVCNKVFRTELIEHLGDGFEYLAKLDGILDLVLEFDGGRLDLEEHAPSDCETPPPARANNKQPETHPRANSTASVANEKQFGLAV